jgi:hypothetical protein
MQTMSGRLTWASGIALIQAISCSGDVRCGVCNPVLAANSFSRSQLTLVRLSAMVKVILGINPGEEGTAARTDPVARPEMTMMSSPRMSGGFIGSALRVARRAGVHRP